MAWLTKDAIEHILGPVDSTLLAEIGRTGATEQELAEAHAWVVNDEPLVNDFHHQPSGRIADLVELLHQIEGPQSEDV